MQNTEYIGLLSNQKVFAVNNNIEVSISGNSGDIFVSSCKEHIEITEDILSNLKFSSNNIENEKYKNLDENILAPNKPLEEMEIEELQQLILNKMAKNGPVTDEMKKTVYENIYKNSLITWVKSFK